MYDISSELNSILEQSHAAIFVGLQINGCWQRSQTVLGFISDCMSLNKKTSSISRGGF